MSGPTKKQSTFSDRAKFLEKCALVAGLAVAVGLLVESGPELAHSIIHRTLPSREVAGSVIVTIGVAGEVFLSWFALRAARRAEIEAEERIALAEKKAAEAELARARIEEQLYKPHLLTTEDITEISEILGTYVGRKRADIFVYDGHIWEVGILGDQINSAFKHAGWKSNLWYGAEPRVLGPEVMFCIARECSHPSREYEDLQSLANDIGAVIFKRGIPIGHSLGGFSTEETATLRKPLQGWGGWDPSDVAIFRVQVGHRQLRKDIFEALRPLTPPQA